MKSLLIVFATLILIIAMPFFFSTIHDAQTEDYTQTFAGITTGAGVYAANVTLGQSAYNNNVNSVTDVSSNISSDAPSAASYASVSKILTVNGLDASQVRTLSVTFDVESTILPSGMSVFFTLFIWFWVFAILGFIGGAIYAFFD